MGVPCRQLGAPSSSTLERGAWQGLPCDYSFGRKPAGRLRWARSKRLPGPSRQQGAFQEKCRVKFQANAAQVLDQKASADVAAQNASQGIPDIWRQMADTHCDLLAVSDPHQSPPAKYTFKELHSHMCQFASGLQQVGLKAGDVVSLFSENSSRWLIADQSTMMLGAADAVRGSTGSVNEMGYIVSHSGSRGVIVQDAATLERLQPALTQSGRTSGNGSLHQPALQENLRFIVVLWGEASDQSSEELSCPVFSFNDIMVKGRAELKMEPVSRDSLATLVYTSGTTGSPKGVELTHANILYQMQNLGYYLQVSPGDSVLSLLPPWHIYERTCSYYILSSGGHQVYTSIRKFKDDLTLYPPDHFVCVPLVLDSLYTKVMQQLKKGSAVKQRLAKLFLAASTAYIRARRVVQGVALEFARKQRPFMALLSAFIMTTVLAPIHRLGQLLVYKKIRQALGIRRTVVSGGGSLASHLDDFYEVVGLEVLNGWGLSETSPVLACRRDGVGSNVRGSIGLPIPSTRLKVVDPETLEEVADGELGLILASGPGVMRGYHHDPDTTQLAMRAGDGFFDTGDLGWRAPEGVPGSNMAGTIVLAGRSKDTIVLSNGENIEPQPIEDACCASSYISHMLVVGQDKRMLGALVAPSQEAFEELQKVKGPLSQEEKESVLKSEISKLMSSRPSREKVVNIVLLPRPLDREDGTLTQTLKPRRQVVFAKYKAEFDQLMSLLR